MAFVMKSFNFITYFISPLINKLKLADVDLLAKIDIHLHSQLSLSSPLAQFPAISKSKRKGPTACTLQAATFSSILYYGKRCVGVDMQKMSFAFSHSIQLFHFQISSKWVPRGLNPSLSLDANLCPFLSPFYYEIFMLIF